MPHTVTLQDLETLRACPEQRELFADTFPDGVTITADNAAASATAAAEAGLNVKWYARRVLTGDEREAYEAAITRAWDVYEAARVAAWTACKAAVNLGQAAYHAADAAHAAEAAAWAVYRAVEAEVLCSILARRGA